MLSAMMSTASAISAFTTIGEAEVSVVGVLCLIVLLGAREIYSESKLWNKHLAISLKLAIQPLGVTFFAVIAFNIMRVVGSLS
jgi:hypothetical protein